MIEFKSVQVWQYPDDKDFVTGVITPGRTTVDARILLNGSEIMVEGIELPQLFLDEIKENVKIRARAKLVEGLGDGNA